MTSRYTAREMRLVADYVCSDFTFARINVGSDARPVYRDIKPFEVASMLRQAADMMERERRYEYGIRVNNSFPDLCGIWKTGDLQAAKTMADEFSDNVGFVTVVRREIVDWEEVPNV